eukprot:COSAG02_NODE_7637_length_2922_cov_6.155863_2_plen_66_part_00
MLALSLSEFIAANRLRRSRDPYYLLITANTTVRTYMYVYTTVVRSTYLLYIRILYYIVLQMVYYY